jgi:hypothetical protein
MRGAVSPHYAVTASTASTITNRRLRARASVRYFATVTAFVLSSTDVPRHRPLSGTAASVGSSAMSTFKVAGGRRRARVARRLIGFALFLMRYGSAAVTAGLIGLALSAAGVTGTISSSRTSYALGLIGVTLISRAVGLSLLLLSRTLVPRAHVSLRSALRLLPRWDDVYDKADAPQADADEPSI